MNNGWKVEVRNLDILYIRVKQLEKVVCHCGFLRVLHTNSEFVRIGRRQIQSKRVIITHGFNKFEEIDHVDTENILLWTVV